MIAELKRELKELSEREPNSSRLDLQNKLVKLQVTLHWMSEVSWAWHGVMCRVVMATICPLRSVLQQLYIYVNINLFGRRRD